MKKKLALMLTLTVLSAALLASCGSKTGPDSPVNGEQTQEVGDPGTTSDNDGTDGQAKEVEQPQIGTPDEEQTIELPILDEIDQTVLVGTAGSSLTAVQGAVKLLDWGVGTGLDAEEIKAATERWLADKDEETKAEFIEKLTSVDNMYQELLKDDAESLLETAGCADAAYPWSDGPVDSIESVMAAAGLR